MPLYVSKPLDALRGCLVLYGHGWAQTAAMTN
jgi:hypothetical protein